MSEQPATSQAVSVTVAPGGPVQLRSGSRERIAGYVVGPENRAVVRVAVPIYSTIEDYQEQLEDFWDVIAQQIGIDAYRERGRVIAELSPRGLLYLDVTRCNHVPMEVRGTKSVGLSMGDRVRFAWEAWLVSVERVDEGDPQKPYRMVAGYRVALREGGDV